MSKASIKLDESVSNAKPPHAYDNIVVSLNSPTYIMLLPERHVAHDQKPHLRRRERALAVITNPGRRLPHHQSLGFSSQIAETAIRPFCPRLSYGNGRGTPRECASVPGSHKATTVELVY